MSCLTFEKGEGGEHTATTDVLPTNEVYYRFFVPEWVRLCDPNTLQFRDVNTTLFHLSLVYDWGEYGDITQYIASRPRASRPPLVGGAHDTAGVKDTH